MCVCGGGGRGKCLLAQLGCHRNKATMVNLSRKGRVRNYLINKEFKISERGRFDKITVLILTIRTDSLS